MSSNKTKRGWKKTYEKNDANVWKRQQRQILLQHSVSDETGKKALQPQKTKQTKNNRC